MIGDTPITMWKWATTKYVSDNGMSIVTLPRNKPVRPPWINVNMNPIANNIGTRR